MERRGIRYRRIWLPALAAILATVSMQSCYWDNEEDLYGNLPCESTNVSYKEDVEPIIILNCYSCHSEVNAPVSGDGLNLEGYRTFSLYAQLYETTLVESIKHEGSASEMPKFAPKLDTCSIKIIENWIIEGRQNN
jgi:hypothetical protein